MNYPQQPQAPGYPPQQFQQPQPGYAAPAPAPGYGQAPTQAPGYAQASVYAQQPVAPQAPVLPRGTLQDFMDQAGGGGTSVTKFFNARPQGSWIQFQVTRDIVESDVQPQTDSNGAIRYQTVGGQPDYNRPRWVLVLKCTVLTTSDGDAAPSVFADGAAAVWLKGITRDGFTGAMSAAGVPESDKALARGKLGGAVFVMQSNGSRPSNRSGYADTKLFTFTYTSNGREHLVDAQPSSTGAIPPTLTPEGHYISQQVSDPAQYAPQAAQLPPVPGVQAVPPAAAPLPAAVPPPAAPPVPPGYAQTAVPAPPLPPAPPAAVAPPPQSAERAQLLADLQGQA